MANENRKYKDSVFCDLYYSDETAEKNLLELYNGLFGENLHDTSLIEKIRLEDVLADYLRRKSEEVVNMLMAEYDYETDIAVHSQEAEARGRAEGEIRGMVTVLYTKLNFSIKNISEELDIKEETVKKILFEKGLIENV